MHSITRFSGRLAVCVVWEESEPDPQPLSKATATKAAPMPRQFLAPHIDYATLSDHFPDVPQIRASLD